MLHESVHATGVYEYPEKKTKKKSKLWLKAFDINHAA